MEPYQQHVVAEKSELDERLDKLNLFMGSATFKAIPFAEQLRMIKQSVAMSLYSEALRERIEAFV